MSYSVGELAALTNVSIRTLHYYDAVGLLVPSGRTRAGYRQYSHADLERLHRILVYRSLGFDLAGIARILDDPATDAIQHLRRQQALLTEEAGRLQGLIELLEAMMAAKQSGYNMTAHEMKEVFGAFDPRQHEDEAAARWGGTDAYAESARRTKQYSKQEWLTIREEADAITREFAALVREGAGAGSDQAVALAERHRQHISRWFYPCDYDVHCGLADMYVADARFTKHYDDVVEGLGRFIRDAVHANAERR